MPKENGKKGTSFDNISRSTKWRLLKRVNHNTCSSYLDGASITDQISQPIATANYVSNMDYVHMPQEHPLLPNSGSEPLEDTSMMQCCSFSDFDLQSGDLSEAKDPDETVLETSQPSLQIEVPEEDFPQACEKEWWLPEGEEPSESDEDEEKETNWEGSQHANEKLYLGAPVTVAESIYAIFVFALRHSLTGECLSDLLVLISLHCMLPNFCRTSLFMFRKFFSNISAPLKCHYYCKFCFQLLNDQTDCAFCKEKFGKTPGSSYFIELPFIFQLKNMFLRTNFYDSLNYRFERKKKSLANIEDIYDGEVYKSLSTDGFSNSQDNISFMWYSDGIPVFKSSKFSLWPIYLVINELNYKKRVLKENMVVAGIWFGSEKPAINSFLKPLHSSFSELAKGVEVNIPGKNEPILVRGRLLCGTCDIPAKSMFLNMTQFNGAFGCVYCKQEGHSVKTYSGTNVYAYPFDNENVDGPLRTNEEMIGYAKVAVSDGKPVFGVKGPSLLYFLNSNCITGMAIDIMHGVFLGVCRKLIHIWFDSKFRTFTFSLAKELDMVEKRLLTIKPPSFVQRVPRSIKTMLKFWKAQEFKYFLLTYSIPVFYGIMSSKYLEHHIMLVSAIFLLSQDSISPNDLALSKNLLIEYVFQFQTLYGEQFMSINVHQLLHLPITVERLGPLWVTSCFPFEDFNGYILKFIHGTQHAELQIGSAISSVIYAPLIREKMRDGSPVSNFCTAMTLKGKPLKLLEMVSNSITTIGCYTILPIIPVHVREALFLTANQHFGTCWIFYRIKINRVVYSCKSYTRVGRHNSYTVSFRYNKTICYGQISCFIKQKLCFCLGKCNCPLNFFAIIKKFTVVSKPVTRFMSKFDGLPNYIIPVKFSNSNLAIDVVELINQLCFIEFDNEMYVTELPNYKEAE